MPPLAYAASQLEAEQLEAERVALALETYIQALQDPESGIPRHDCRHNFLYFRNVFSGADAADWFMDNMEGVHTVEAAQQIGQKFMDLGIILSIDVCAWGWGGGWGF